MKSKLSTAVLTSLTLLACVSCSSVSALGVKPPLQLVMPVQEAARQMGPFDYMRLLIDAHQLNCATLSVLRGEDPMQCLLLPPPADVAPEDS